LRAELTGTVLTDDAAVATDEAADARDEAADSRDETTSEVDWATATAAKVVKMKERILELFDGGSYGRYVVYAV